MIFCDADILFKLNQDERLNLLISFAKKLNKQIQITDEVYSEIIDKESQIILDNLCKTPQVSKFDCPSNLQKEIALRFSQLRKIMDKGEASIYSAAEIMNGAVLSNDKTAYDAYCNHCRRTKREVIQRYSYKDLQNL